jgi:hypothetical protein
MAVPYITNISPNSGHTSGETQVRILGGNFQVPAVGSGSTPTVTLTFGGVSADKIQVVNSALMYARVPSSRITSSSDRSGTGAVDVVLSNIDSAGVLIPGETVTVSGGYTYQGWSITSRSDLQRLVENFIIELRRQVIDEVAINKHTDYDSATGDGLNIVDIAKVPALVLIGPSITENRFYSLNENEVISLSDGTTLSRRPGYTVDVEFEILGVSDRDIDRINLEQQLLVFFHKNKFLRFECTEGDASTEIQLEMDWVPGLQPKITDISNNSNILEFSGNVVIRGFTILSPAGFESNPQSSGAIERSKTLDNGVKLQTTEQIGTNPTYLGESGSKN